MPFTRLAAQAALILLACVAFAGCGASAPERTPPVGDLPDPVAIVPAESLAALFGGAELGEPSCRYAESNYRCTWADFSNAERQLTVTIYADSGRAVQQIAAPGARSLAMPGASQSAVISQQDEVTVWAAVGELGLQVAFAAGDGDPAAHEAAAVALATVLAAAMGG